MKTIETAKCIGGFMHGMDICTEQKKFWLSKSWQSESMDEPEIIECEYELEKGYFRCTTHHRHGEGYLTDTEFDNLIKLIEENERT